MRRNLLPAMLLMLLGGVLAEWLSTRAALAQGLPPSSGGGSDYTHPSAISLPNGINSADGGTFTGDVTATGKFVSTAPSGATAFSMSTGARMYYNVSNKCESLAGYFWCDGTGFYGIDAQFSSYRNAGTSPFVMNSFVDDAATAVAYSTRTIATLSTAGAVVHAWESPTGTTRMRLTSFGGLQLPGMTTAARDALTGADLRAGTIIYNTTTNKLNFYNGTSWEGVTSL